MITITVNDEIVELESPTTIAELLQARGIPEKGIAVALDWAVLPRADWDRAVVDGARIEVVTAVQGG